MKPCDHAAFCGKRMAEGDRANGCNSIDQRTCSPVVTVFKRTPTAPPADQKHLPNVMHVLDGEPPR